MLADLAGRDQLDAEATSVAYVSETSSNYSEAQWD